MVRHVHTSRSRGRLVQQAEKQDARLRAFEVLRLMRSDHLLSLAQAARKAHTTPRTVLTHVAPALRRVSGGRYVAKASDTLLRTVRFITPTGAIAVAVSLRTASRISKHSIAVDRFLQTGETDALEPFRGRFIRLGNIRHPFITDPRTLTRLGNAGEIAFEDLYVVTI